MNKKKLLLLSSAALVIVLIVASVLYQQFSGNVDNDNLAANDPAAGQSGQSQASQNQSEQDAAKQFPPDFTVLDSSGKEVSLSDFRGKPTVVNFWASWCGPCKREMPDFDKIYRQMGDDIHFLMVNMTDGSRETPDIAKAFVADSGYHFPVYYDTQYSAMMAYGVYSLPTTYFFDAEGYAIAQATGAIDEETLLRGISMIAP